MRKRATIQVVYARRLRILRYLARVGRGLTRDVAMGAKVPKDHARADLRALVRSGHLVEGGSPKAILWESIGRVTL